MGTTYKGRKMRSQLEARWAAFFDAVGWEYDYEPPLALKGWLPDFIIYAGEYKDDDGVDRQHKILVEVKPYSTKGAYSETTDKIEKALKGTEWHGAEVLLLGTSIFKSKQFKGDKYGMPAYGLLGWFYQNFHTSDIVENKKRWITKRITCEAYTIEIYGDDSKSYDLTDGDFFSRIDEYWVHCYGASYALDWSHAMDYDELKELWDKAGNKVQWQPRKLS